MKRFTQCVCLILVFSLMLVFPAAAAEIRASRYFMSYSTYFEHVSGNKYEVWFGVTAVDEMDELGVKSITVKRSTDEVNWSTVATFNKSNYPQMVDEDGAITHSGYVPCTCTSGYYYYAIVELYAKDGSSTATMSVNTSILDLT